MKFSTAIMLLGAVFTTASPLQRAEEGGVSLLDKRENIVMEFCRDVNYGGGCATAEFAKGTCCMYSRGLS